jgi:hypothetical protein
LIRVEHVIAVGAARHSTAPMTRLGKYGYVPATPLPGNASRHCYMTKASLPQSRWLLF